MKNQDLSVLKAIILREMEERKMCNECGAMAMYEGMCTECGYMEEDVKTPNPLTDYDGKPAIPGLGPIVGMEEKKKLSSKQKYIAKQTPPKDEINKADFEKLRGMKKEDHEGTDHEVSMANNSIDSILWAANELKKHLQGGERDIPAWIQDHITNAENYIVQAAKNYHEYGSQEDDFSDMDSADYEEEMDEMSLNSLMEAKEKNVKEGVKKVGKKYAVYSKKGKRLGTHTSRAKANKQMAAIEISKQGK